MNVESQIISAEIIRSSIYLVIFGCFLVGNYYTLSISENFDAESQRKWRVAHSGTMQQALLGFAMAYSVNMMILSYSQLKWFKRCVNGCIWFNAFGYSSAAITGFRGFEPICLKYSSPILINICKSSSNINTLVNSFYVIAIFSLMGLIYYVLIGTSAKLSTLRKKAT